MLIVEIECFKEINDRYGHSAGDQVLINVADTIRRVFEKGTILGRLGGDEFVVFVYCPMTKEEISIYMEKLKNEIGKIRIESQKVTCSVGMIPVENGYTIEKLYRSADRLLYEAKKQGRDQFVYGSSFEKMGKT